MDDTQPTHDASLSQAPLAVRARNAGGDDPDAILEQFLDHVAELGLELYPAQEEAVLEIVSGNNVILSTPTGSGKSMVALAMHFKGLCEGKVSVYTSPIKALVSEKFFALCEVLGAENVGMLTGDASINPLAPIICCTAEVLANRALRDGDRTDVDYAILDEFHYYSDRDRGMAWQIPLLALPQTTFLLMSATLGDTQHLSASLEDITGTDVSTVRSDDRPVPLDYEYRNDTVIEAVTHLVKIGKAPVYVVNFTQRAAAETAQSLTSTNFCTKEEKKALRKAMSGFRFDSPYGKDVQRVVSQGIGLHHAGLLPKYRLLVERLAQQGLLKVICGTDTLGVGINIPLRTVLFSKLCKFDGQKVRILSVRDFKQIGGRAGRKGYDEEGTVVALPPEHVLQNRRAQSKAQSAGRKKYNRVQPPKRGFVPWDNNTFTRLIENPPERLESVFSISHGMMLNLLEREPTTRDGGYRRLVQLIARAHESKGSRTRLRRTAAALFRALRHAGIVQVDQEPGLGGASVRINPDLQLEFSLNHSLSLYLVATLEKLDPESDEYPLQVMTLVEAILESPRVILLRQLDWLKGQVIAELKAEGVPYEQRIEALEELTHPKPLEDFIYDSFNRFAEHRPWLQAEAIRPKSIARDLYETYSSFSDYVRQYGLQRSEGVLLRYLTQAYKTLVQNVPGRFRTEPVVELIAYLRTMLARVDASLVQAWEEMLHQNELDEAGADADDPRRQRDVLADKRAFYARVRAELNQLVRAIAVGDYEAAAAGLQTTDEEETTWDAERLRATMAAYFEARPRLRFDHEARLSDKTQIRETGPRQWEVNRILVDADDENDWSLALQIDLQGVRECEGPLLRLLRLEH